MSLTIQGVKIFAVGILLFILSVSDIYSGMPSEKRFELKISGGINHLSGTDFNASEEGWRYIRRVSAEAAGDAFASELNPLDWGGEIAGEITFHLSRLSLSGGLGYISGRGSSEDVTTLNGVTTGTSTTNLDAKAIPVTLGIYYFLPVSPKSQVFLNAGVGYYFVNFSRTARRENDSPYWIDTEFTGSGGDFGFHGGIGFEYSLSKSASLLIEGLGRFAKIKGFEGTRNRNDSNNWSDSIKGKYFTHERLVWGEYWHIRSNIFVDPPSGEDVRNVRDLEIDFSGYTIRVGVKIKLF